MEIDSTVGNGVGASNRPVGLDDRPLMSYTDATLHEILRHSCLVYAIPHSATENVRISSYDIPRYVFIPKYDLFPSQILNFHFYQMELSLIKLFVKIM